MSRYKELETRLERTEQQAPSFQSISRMMVRNMSLGEILHETVQLVGEFMQCDSCLMYLMDRDDLVLCASNPPHPGNIGKVRLKIDEGLTGWVAGQRRLLAISREAFNDPRFKYFSDLPEDAYHGFLSAPIAPSLAIALSASSTCSTGCLTCTLGPNWNCCTRWPNRLVVFWCSRACLRTP